MGLYVHNLGNLPNTADGRDYFIYVLDYGWKEPLANTLRENFNNMAWMASQSKSVVIAGIEPIHFANEVFSWYGINGENGEKILPAILISTLTPAYFRDHNNDGHKSGKLSDKLLLIPLKSACKSSEDVVGLIKGIFSDIREKKKLSGFSVAKRISKNAIKRFADAVILEPNVNGIGIDLKKLL